MKKVCTLTLSILFCLSLLSACGAPKEDPPSTAEPTELRPIVFTEPVRGYHWAPAYLAETLGYFKDEGLKADFQTVSGADASAPVFAGEAQFGLRGVEMALISTEAGQGCKILASTTAVYPYQLIGANESYSTVESLAGKVIAGGQGSASAPQAFSRAVLTQAGVEATILNMASSAYLAAIKSGDIQAAIATNPWSSKLLLENGGKVIVDGAEKAAMEALMGSQTYELFMVFATDKYIAEKPETVQKTVRAIARAMDWMDKATPEDIAKQLEPLFEGRYEELLYSATVDKETGLSNATGYHTDSGYAAALQLTARSGAIQNSNIPADSVYDESFLDLAWGELSNVAS